MEKLTSRDVLLDLTLANKKELVGNVKVGGSLSCSDPEMVAFRILAQGSLTLGGGGPG